MMPGSDFIAVAGNPDETGSVQSARLEIANKSLQNGRRD